MRWILLKIMLWNCCGWLLRNWIEFFDTMTNVILWQWSSISLLLINTRNDHSLMIKFQKNFYNWKVVHSSNRNLIKSKTFSMQKNMVIEIFSCTSKKIYHYCLWWWSFSFIGSIYGIQLCNKCSLIFLAVEI